MFSVAALRGKKGRFTPIIYEFSAQPGKDLPNGVSGATIGETLHYYCRIPKSKLALGYGEWQSTVDTVTRLLKEAPNLQGIYKEAGDSCHCRKRLLY